MSSIFENDKLISDLIKSAVDHEVKFNKYGQIAGDPSVNVDYRNYLTLTKKLADQLEQRYFPTAPTDTAVTTGTGQDAPLGVPELASLGNFLDYAVNNQILVDGKRVAYGAGETVPDPRLWLPITAEQIRFMQETVTPEGERTQFKADYYVNKDLLVKYIETILKEVSKQDESAQRFAKTMLGSLIQRINQIFKTKLSTDYKEPEKSLPDTTQVDLVPQVLDPAQWGQRGAMPLLLGDLKSLETLNAWFSRTKVAVKVTDKNPATIEDQDFDQCIGIQVLHMRAQAAVHRATLETKAGAQVYLNRITQIATQANCGLTMQSGRTAPGGVDARTSAQNALIAGLAMLRPFNSQNINFQEIKSFLDKYKVLANNAQINAVADVAEREMDEANKLLLSPGAPLQMDNLTTTQVKLLVRDPVGGAIPLMNHLYTIISNAGRVYQHFVTQFKSAYDERTWDSMEQQIVSGGPQQTNLGTILDVRDSLISQVPQGRR